MGFKYSQMPEGLAEELKTLIETVPPQDNLVSIMPYTKEVANDVEMVNYIERETLRYIGMKIAEAAVGGGPYIVNVKPPKHVENDFMDFFMPGFKCIVKAHIICGSFSNAKVGQVVNYGSQLDYPNSIIFEYSDELWDYDILALNGSLFARHSIERGVSGAYWWRIK